MIFVTNYKVKPFLSKAQTSDLMAAFAELGTAPGTTAHYVYADGGGGIVIAESDDPTEGYRSLLDQTELGSSSTQRWCFGSRTPCRTSWTP